MKTLIIIPARMASKRFPNKPMALIDGKPMIQRVWEQAISSKLGDVLVACSEIEVFEYIKSLGGLAKMTDPELPSGTDRIYEALKKINNAETYESIINLQGDMPIIEPSDIEKVNIPIKQGFDIGTLVTNLLHNQLKDKNITKAQVKWIKKYKLGKADDFFKSFLKTDLDNIYHHVGIYSFRFETLKKFVNLIRSKNEIERQLEQMRALDSKMTIGVTYVKDIPISVDTIEELKEIENLIKNK